jgi:hypothetical protein
MTDTVPAHPASLDDASLLAQCRVDRRRGAGPGGQHRNKTESAVELHHQPTGLTAQAGERRSQHENQRKALRRLRLNLAVEVRGSHDRARPSDLWQARRQGNAIPVNVKHADFPALLAEAMDIIAACREDVPKAARCLGISTSQLLKLLKKHPPALERVNQQRQRRGLHPMK